MKRYLKTSEEVTQELRDGKTVQTNEMEYGIINNLIVGFDKIVREISINPVIRLSENPYINELEPLKLEVGKFYKTRNGSKAFVYAKIGIDCPYPFCVVNAWKLDAYNVNEEGKQAADERPLDLIATWEE